MNLSCIEAQEEDDWWTNGTVFCRFYRRGSLQGGKERMGERRKATKGELERRVRLQRQVGLQRQVHQVAEGDTGPERRQVAAGGT